MSIDYTDARDDGAYEVVTTLAPRAAEGGAPVRFVTALAPGQGQTVAVGRFAPATAPATLEIVRDDGVLAVNVVGNSEGADGVPAPAGGPES